MRHDAADIGADPRARRRKTIPPGQLALALDGAVDHVWAYSFIVTNLLPATATATASDADLAKIHS